jgi:serine/threonine-protein kinase RsbW
MAVDGISFQLKASIPELARLSQIIQDFGERHRLPQKTIFELNLVVEESVSNVIKYGYQDEKEHAIHVSLSFRPGEVTVEVEDDGCPFNPLSMPERDVHQHFEDREIGRLGVHLMRKIMDEMEYERHGDKNILRMKKKLRSA